MYGSVENREPRNRPTIFDKSAKAESSKENNLFKNSA